MKSVIGKLSDDRIQIEPADLQAILWYLERELYYAFGRNKKSDADDYAGAAEATNIELAKRASRVSAPGRSESACAAVRLPEPGNRSPLFKSETLAPPVERPASSDREQELFGRILALMDVPGEHREFAPRDVAVAPVEDAPEFPLLLPVPRPGEWIAQDLAPRSKQVEEAHGTRKEISDDFFHV
jgi:hypothetical protein